MTLTLGNYIAIGVIALCALLISVACTVNSDHTARVGIISAIVSLVCIVGLALFLSWYNTNTASGIRSYKDFTSEMGNGIERKIVITAEDGRKIFEFEGKVDLDMDNEGNYMRFETQDGKRYTIEYGVQDTVLVIEK